MQIHNALLLLCDLRAEHDVHPNLHSKQQSHHHPTVCLEANHGTLHLQDEEVNMLLSIKAPNCVFLNQIKFCTCIVLLTQSVEIESKMLNVKHRSICMVPEAAAQDAPIIMQFFFWREPWRFFCCGTF